MDGGGEGGGKQLILPPLNIDTLILKPKKQLFCWDERTRGGGGGEETWRRLLLLILHTTSVSDYILDDLDNVAARRPKTT